MRVLALLLTVVAFAADPTISQEGQTVVDHISADSLRGRLSFLASDLLEGRATPSRGLDLAAEYIASEFRRVGLEPAGDDQYFQTATLITREQNSDGFEMTVQVDGKTIRIPAPEVSILTPMAMHLENVPIILAENPSAEDRAGGKVIVWAGTGPRPNFPSNAALVLSAVQSLRAVTFDPETPPRQPSLNTIAAPELVGFLKDAKDARVTLHVGPAIERPAKVRNVAGILRGSGPVLRDTYVMLTAHYDHLGIRGTGADRIFNGANDDGSGTVSVIEVAQALAALNPRPKRSILFVTFFGEELGLFGSRYYGRHPLEPFSQTIADMNLEQVGRTDDTQGPRVGTANVTGFDFSNLTGFFVEAGKLTGVKVVKDEKNSDPYFARSDNQSLADAGVPAHTLSVAYNFPDYHGAGDEWPKIDYDNMAKVDRMVALALLNVASSAVAPSWNGSNPAAKRYVDAAKKLK